MSTLPVRALLTPSPQMGAAGEGGAKVDSALELQRLVLGHQPDMVGSQGPPAAQGIP
jgi:hypothetical protein